MVNFSKRLFGPYFGIVKQPRADIDRRKGGLAAKSGCGLGNARFAGEVERRLAIRLGAGQTDRVGAIVMVTPTAVEQMT
jgi:hypothetical protein